MTNCENYAFVLDAEGKQLSPTKEKKAWYLIRKKRAILVSKYPMVIQLNKIVSNDNICKDEIRCGIDDGGLHVGIALVQKCQTKNKTLFKGTIEQRNDVKHLMKVRWDYRRYRRYHKRYRPKRINNRSSSKSGSNTLGNLITLCESCHQKTEGKEEQYMQHYFNILESSDNKNLNYASYVMIGKTWLRKQLSQLGVLNLTTGGNTANKRIDWNIEKSHSNDAVCITDLQPDSCNVKDWIIKPMRRQSKAKTDNVLGIKHRDLVSYVYKNGELHTGYVTALYPKLNALNFQSPTKHCKKVNVRKCRVLWKYNKIYWLDSVS